jgi:hypothetical protein
MELYFDMGGREYLDERKSWREPGEPEPTVDDAVFGLASIFEALAVGDNDRFHLETVHHSRDEIELILDRGGKIEHAAYIVDDEEEDEEFGQYHGFTMTMW